VEERGPTGKKVRGDTLQGGGDTRMKSIKSASDEQKRSSVFQEKINRGDTAELATKRRSPGFSRKNRGVTPSFATPGVTHPSDSTGDNMPSVHTGLFLLTY